MQTSNCTEVLIINQLGQKSRMSLFPRLHPCVELDDISSLLFSADVLWSSGIDGGRWNFWRKTANYSDRNITANKGWKLYTSATN